MESDKEVALYYPYIDISNGSLVKTSALYWDELQTIVPESVKDPYESPISKEAFDTGFLKPRIVHPEDEPVIKAGKEFYADIVQEDVKQRVIKTIRETKRKRFSRIHLEKWAEEYLWKVWLAIRDEISLSPDTDDYVIFPAPFGDAYMSRLASVIAQQDKIIPLTNLPNFQDILIDRFIDYSEGKKQNRSELAKLSLQTILVNPDVPLAQILKFRGKHRKELLKFRLELRKLVKYIGEGLDTNAKQKALQDIVNDEISPKREEIEAKMSESNITFTISAIGITIPTVIGIMAAGGLIALAGGIVSLTSVLACSVYTDRQYIKGHPLGYLYQAQKKFGVKK